MKYFFVMNDLEPLFYYVKLVKSEHELSEPTSSVQLDTVFDELFESQDTRRVH